MSADQHADPVDRMTVPLGRYTYRPTRVGWEQLSSPGNRYGIAFDRDSTTEWAQLARALDEIVHLRTIIDQPQAPRRGDDCPVCDQGANCIAHGGRA